MVCKHFLPFCRLFFSFVIVCSSHIPLDSSKRPINRTLAWAGKNHRSQRSAKAISTRNRTTQPQMIDITVIVCLKMPATDRETVLLLNSAVSMVHGCICAVARAPKICSSQRAHIIHLSEKQAAAIPKRKDGPALLQNPSNF